MDSYEPYPDDMLMHVTDLKPMFAKQPLGFGLSSLISLVPSVTLCSLTTKIPMSMA